MFYTLLCKKRHSTKRQKYITKLKLPKTIKIQIKSEKNKKNLGIKRCVNYFRVRVC